jgi:uncharacterized protein YjbI with pentapeptide repeats
MANPEHLAILKQGVEQWNKWTNEHYDVTPDLSRADLEKASLGWANLGGANLRGANLREAILTRANLGLGAKVDHGRPYIRKTDLGDSNLRGANLSRADLCETNLNGADLSRADLSGASLIMADLSGADLTGANPSGADLFGADLSDANLSEADLFGANLRGANLSGTHFTLARAFATNFADVDLSVAKGLETMKHQGPSTVGIDTIYKSHGKIPDVFLRGCGVPDEFIAYIGSMVGRPIEFYSCFISYSTKDQEFAERLHADLQAKGVRCWFAPHDIKGGRKLHEQIDEAIRLHDRLLLILSEHSMSSEWVKTEIAKARKREVKEGKRVLFPVRLVEFDVLRDWECFDGDTGKDSAREIREYFIPDFSNWKDHDSYQTAFQRLVSDLKAEANK